MKTIEKYIEIILQELGKNHTDPAVINYKSGRYGVYTHEGEVFVLTDGLDVEFNALDSDEQERIVRDVLSKKFKVDPSFQ